MFERAETEPVRGLVSIPPRCGKTETLLMGIAWYLLRNPDKVVAYVTYGDVLTKSKSTTARLNAVKAGVIIRRDSNSKNEWRTTEGGGLLATSLAGSIIGHGVNLLIVDDSVKDRATAESALEREHVIEWFQNTANSRLQPGSSIIIVQQRWREDDLIGWCLKSSGTEWEYLNLPALNEQDESIWPEIWSVPDWHRKRQEVGPYAWASMYMGQPVPKGMGVFKGEAQFYDPEQTPMCRETFGVDLAYTAKSKSDHSVAILLGLASDGKYYVLDMVRRQTTADKFSIVLKNLYKEHPNAPMFSYVGGVEKGTIDLLRSQGVPIQGVTARTDKFLRSQAASILWNNGKILLPKGRSWAGDLLDEIKSFTGVNDQSDDCIDAMAGALHGFTYKPPRRNLQNLFSM